MKICFCPADSLWCLITLLLSVSLQWQFAVCSRILHDTFRIFVFCASYSCLSLLITFLFNCLFSHTTILSSLPTALSFSSTTLTAAINFSVYLCLLFSLILPSRHFFMSLSSCILSVPCLCAWWLLLQRVVKTPSAAHEVPVCPASTGIPKRQSPHFSLQSPMRARMTPCPPPVYGWAPA